MFANKYKVAGVNLSNLKTIWGDGVQTEPGTPEHQERMARRVGPDIVPIIPEEQPYANVIQGPEEEDEHGQPFRRIIPVVAPENDVTDGTR